MQGFFGALWRFNAVVIAIAGVLMVVAASFSIFVVGSELFSRKAQNVAILDGEPTVTEREIAISEFRRIDGAALLSADLYENSEIDVGYSRSKSAHSTRNVIVYDAARRETWALFKEPNPLILGHQALYDPRSESRAFAGMSVRYIDEDTNGDQRLTISDGVKLAIFDKSMRNPLKIDGYFAEMSDAQIIDGEIVVIAGVGERVTAFHISLDSRTVDKVEREAPVPIR